MKQTYVILLALLVAFLWGVAPVIHKHVLKSISPHVVLIISGVSYITCLAIFAAIHQRKLIEGIKHIHAKYVLIIALTSIFTAFIANIIYLNVLKHQDSYIISALIYACPVFTLILAYVFLKEKVTLFGGLGVFFIILGVICIIFNEKGHHPEEYLNVR